MNHRAAASKTCCFKRKHRWWQTFCSYFNFKMPKSKKSKQDSIVTRSDLTNWFLGPLLREIPQNQLPTTIDCLRHYYFLKETEFGGRTTSIEKGDLCKRIARMVHEIWSLASIYTTKKLANIEKKVRRKVDKAQSCVLPTRCYDTSSVLRLRACAPAS